MRWIRRKLRKIGRFSRLRRSDATMTFEALMFLGMARMWLVIAPFRKVAETIGTAHPAPAPTDVLAAASPDQERIAQQISEAVQRAAKNVPFRAVCIHQAVAAKLMLARRDIDSVMHFGVGRRSEERSGEMRAHAWLATANGKITGYPVDDDLTEIAYFV